ncbi:MAG: carbamoyl phosphate synthase small subunit, partial [Alphaproteobacteria bacterium]|nr:carbamoyl phosphate synthase small subunit [Alphaproteobacteria bacterium]
MSATTETPAQGSADTRPTEADAALVLADGTVFWGRGAGAAG